MTIQSATHEKLRWGILGCARVAERVLIPGIQRSHNGQVFAIASRDLAKAREFAARFGIPRAYGSYEALLDDAEVQAIYIPLPNLLHCEWTIKTAQAGKPVLCEKPFACNAGEAQAMVEAGRRHGVMIAEAFAQRHHPQNLLVKRLIQEGRIGEVLWMTVAHSSARPTLPNDVRLKKELCGGILMDKGCYCVNQARFIFGEEPTTVYATAEYGPTGVDERVLASLRFPSGGAAEIDTSFRLQGQDIYYQSYELFGKTGRIVVPKGLTQVETYRQGRVEGRTIEITDDSGTEKIEVPPAHHWQLEAEHFADCVLSDRGLTFPAEDGLANTRVMDAIFESARTGLPVAM